MVKSRKTAPAKEQEIIAAAASLFKKKGYRATTLEDIAAAVGMLKGSLYYYIRSKEELLYLVVRDPIRQAYNKLEETPKEYQQLLTQLLQQGVDSGELRSDLDVTVAGYAILGMCNWMYRWYKPEGHMSAEAIADVFTKLVLEGLQQSV